MKGRIKFYYADRGFGFLRSLDGSPDLFFHFSDSTLDIATVPDDAILSFEVIKDARKAGALKAVNILISGE